jgi:DNA-binding SARP family transcriptional activator
VSEYCVSLFGRFLVKKEELVLEGFEGAKVQELFGYLLLHPNRQHHREHLASILWPEQPSTPAKKYLRKALWQLQNSLSQLCEDFSDSVISIDGDWVQFNVNSALHVDAVIFEQVYESVRETHGSQFDKGKASLIARTTELYQDDLLQGWYQDWCLFERERFLHMYLNFCDKLMRYFAVSGTFGAGVAYGTKILRHDRARENTHRQLMRLHYLSGNRTDALRQYERCVRALNEELGVEPARLTQKLYQQICSDSLTSDFFQPASLLQSKRLADKRPLSQTLAKLKQMEGSLSYLQQDLQNEIAHLESQLNPPPTK